MREGAPHGTAGGAQQAAHSRVTPGSQPLS